MLNMLKMILIVLMTTVLQMTILLGIILTNDDLGEDHHNDDDSGEDHHNSDDSGGDHHNNDDDSGGDHDSNDNSGEDHDSDDDDVSPDDQLPTHL